MAAAQLARGGARVLTIAEQAPLGRLALFAAGLWRQPGKLVEGLRARAAARGAAYRPGTWVTAAHGAGRVEAVTLRDGRREWRQACDLLCCGYGLVPNLELARLLGCETPSGVVPVDERQRTRVTGVLAAGEPTGVAGVEQALVTGQIAGLTAAGGEPEPGLRRQRAVGQRFAARLARAFALRDELRRLPTPETIVCRCEDVRWGALPARGSLRALKLVITDDRGGWGRPPRSFADVRTHRDAYRALVAVLRMPTRSGFRGRAVPLLASLFAALGRASHSEETALTGAFMTAWPFLVGTVVGWTLVRGGSKNWPVTVAHGIPVWASTLIVGMLIRVVIGAGTALSFILVAGSVLAVFLLGWRWLAQRYATTT